MNHTLPPLPYDYGALEPYLDALTLEIHHAKHHQAYVDNFNKTIANYPDLQTKPIDQILKSLDTVPKEIRTGVINFGGGYYNHSFFWQVMKKNGGGKPNGKVGTAIDATFGSFDAFQEQFNTTSKTLFGSGWAWLCADNEKKLVIVPTLNQDCPLSRGFTPLLCLDVWEHAYYLKYQNRRPDFINAWWHVVNWDQVEEHYQEVKLR
ncbi:MAG: superoxide dismutase [bacterium]|nr:superoxide dismutase [bacterium]